MRKMLLVGVMVVGCMTTRFATADPDRSRQWVTEARSLTDIRRALILYQKAIQADSSNDAAWEGAVEAHVRLQDVVSAEKLVVAMAYKHPVVSQRSRGRIQVLKKQWNEAIHSFETALEQEPDHEPTVVLLAQAYLAIDNPTAARRIVKTHLQNYRNAVGADFKKMMAQLGLTESKIEESSFREIRNQTKITRSQLALLLTGVFKVSCDARPAIRFKDIDANDVNANVYSCAVQNGLLDSLPDMKFHPDHVVSRRNLLRFLVKQSVEVSSDDPAVAAVRTLNREGVTTPGWDNFDLPITGEEAYQLTLQCRERPNK